MPKDTKRPRHDEPALQPVNFSPCPEAAMEQNLILKVLREELVCTDEEFNRIAIQMDAVRRMREREYAELPPMAFAARWILERI
ncbi:hypothetical protein Q8309_001387 [Salmonella enterica]|nr:hypothetical protein [Salmonella enterica]